MMYNRENAVLYAQEWAYRRNPRYFDFSKLGGDCTNFASQCIYAGAQVMNYTPTFGWYYISVGDRAPAWTGVDELYRFLISNKGAGPQGEVVPLRNIMEGDIVLLRCVNGERFDHSPVVVDRGNGTPDSVLVAAHTKDSDSRQLSTYRYNATRPIHINNVGENR